MEENMKEIENDKLNTSEKLSWEAPKLYSLDKRRTENGNYVDFNESIVYSGES